jgi:hypothetical protein
MTTAKINRHLHLKAGELTSRLTMVVTMGLEQFALTLSRDQATLLRDELDGWLSKGAQAD